MAEFTTKGPGKMARIGVAHFAGDFHYRACTFAKTSVGTCHTLLSEVLEDCLAVLLSKAFFQFEFIDVKALAQLLKGVLFFECCLQIMSYRVQRCDIVFIMHVIAAATTFKIRGE